VDVVGDFRWDGPRKDEPVHTCSEDTTFYPITDQLGCVQRIPAGADRDSLGQVAFEIHEAANEPPAVFVGKRF
jgi:hypothetical protein